MHSAADVGSTAASAQECVNLVAVAAPTALAISFDSITGACKYSTSVYSYYLRATGQQPSFYLRTDNVTKDLSESDCLTRQDGEYLVARLSFGDEQCVMSTYDSASGLCIVNDYTYDFGKYNAGRLRNDTWYMLSQDQVKASINYKCANEEHSKMIVGGTWYCYGAITLATGQANVSLIKDNYCAQTFGSGSNPVKITEAREYGYIYYWWPDQTVYLGAYLQSGTTYVWYDGSAASDLPWAIGRPLGATNDMVFVNSDFSVTDGDASKMSILPCKTPATYSAYDPSTKFL